MPIWPKVRAYEVLSIGYSAGSSDCIMSFSRWQKLIAASTEKAVRPAAPAGLTLAAASFTGFLGDLRLILCRIAPGNPISPLVQGGPGRPGGTESGFGPDALIGGQLQQVEFLLCDVEGIVPDDGARPQIDQGAALGRHGAPKRLREGCAGLCGPGPLEFTLAEADPRLVLAAQCLERRGVLRAVQRLERGPSGLHPGEAYLLVHGAVVFEPDPRHQGTQGHALHDQGHQHYGEGTEEDQVTIGESRSRGAVGEGHRGRERHDSAHSAPGNDEATPECGHGHRASAGVSWVGSCGLAVPQPPLRDSVVRQDPYETHQDDGD